MFFFSLLVAISTLMSVPSAVEAQLTLPTVLNITNINGTVSCALNVTVSANGSLIPANAPPFPGAIVRLRCNNTIATAIAITNSNGFFVIPLTSLTSPTLTIPTLLNNCSLVVTTPLSRCNATLAASVNGTTLTSPLQQANPPTTSLLSGLTMIYDLTCTIFNLLPIV